MRAELLILRLRGVDRRKSPFLQRDAAGEGRHLVVKQEGAHKVRRYDRLISSLPHGHGPRISRGSRRVAVETDQSSREWSAPAAAFRFNRNTHQRGAIAPQASARGLLFKPRGRGTIGNVEFDRRNTQSFDAFVERVREGLHQWQRTCVRLRVIPFYLAYTEGPLTRIVTIVPPPVRG